MFPNAPSPLLSSLSPRLHVLASRHNDDGNAMSCALRHQNLAAVVRRIGMVSRSVVVEHPASDGPLDRQSPLATLGHILICC